MSRIPYTDLNKAQRQAEIQALDQRIAGFKAAGLKLNLTRGRQSAAQLELSNDLQTCLQPGDFRSEDGTDCRNYGGLEGIPEARRLFAEILGTEPQNVLVEGSSSLNVMYDMVVRAMHTPVPGATEPWQAGVDRFLCPVPGYDRHFTICQTLGIGMIPVPMTPDGPDMDEVERLAAADSTIKGIWCTPVYSNPDGIVYTPETCRRLAAMPTAASDFRIYWDNAYLVHHLNPQKPRAVPDILQLCADAGYPDRPYEFASFSKVTYAGASICCVASSPANIAYIRSCMNAQTIGPDKMNQLRHVRFLPDKAAVEAHMARHAQILAPKFAAVREQLDEELGNLGICDWNNPEGGYFLSLFVLPGTATAAVALAKSCGIEVTPAGSTWPYGKDPQDSNIRLAPTMPTPSDLRTAIEVLAVCIRRTALDKLSGSET